jgi:hypothetical protein
MQLTVEEALSLLNRLGDNVRQKRLALEEAEDARNALIRAFDGQPGMARTAMAMALGIDRTRVFVIANERKPERESLAGDGVPMDQALYDALVEVVGQFARNVRDAESVHLDVR